MTDTNATGPDVDHLWADTGRPDTTALSREVAHALVRECRAPADLGPASTPEPRPEASTAGLIDGRQAP